MASTLAMGVMVAGCLATAAVLWLGADAAPIAAFTRFAVLGGLLAALVPARAARFRLKVSLHQRGQHAESGCDARPR